MLIRQAFVYDIGFYLLLAALIGWLVGWLWGRFRKNRTAESLDAELAGKVVFPGHDHTRLQQENAFLRTRIDSLEFALRNRPEFSLQLSDPLDLSSAFAAVRERDRLRAELAQARHALQARTAREPEMRINAIQLTTTN